ncbi:MAG: hypothetical protein QOI77_848, partial [Blastocatellia bacterium]|nr:hypothetical protein [Blastocatellia bacterium]
VAQKEKEKEEATLSRSLNKIEVLEVGQQLAELAGGKEIVSY